MREFIVLCTEHYNPLGIVRTLGQKGIQSTVITVKDSFKMVSKSKYCKKAYFVDNAEEGVQLIIDLFSSTDEKPIILTGDDKTVHALDNRYDDLKDHFYFYNAGKTGRVSFFMDKDNAKILAEKHGLNCPKTWIVKNGSIPEDITFPVMTKAVNSFGKEWKGIVFVCKSTEDLLEAFTKIKSEELILQQFIEKVDEVDFEGVSCGDGKDVLFCCQTFQKYCLYDKYSPYFVTKPLTDFDTASKIKNMLSEVGFNGIFEAEFIKDAEGKLWFLEINYRNTAWGYSTTKAGVSQVLIWIESLLNNNKIPEESRSLVAKEITAMAECWDYDVRVKGKMITRKEWMKEYKKVDAKMYKGENDFWPFWHFMIHKFFCKLK